MPNKDVVLIKAKCPVCGIDYDYIEGGYIPHTCKDIICLHKFLHDPQYQVKPIKEPEK